MCILIIKACKGHENTFKKLSSLATLSMSPSRFGSWTRGGNTIRVDDLGNGVVSRAGSSEGS